MTSLLNKIVFILCFTLQVFANAQTFDKDGIPDVPQPYALVNDFAQLLSNDNKQDLEKKLLAYNDSTTNQIYVITVSSIGDYSIEDFALRTARKWKIGQQDKNNGILLLISKNDRKVDIEVGYGLESSVTDYDSKHIIDDIIVPAFKQSNYHLGIDKATDRLMGLIQGTYITEVAKNEPIPIWVYFLIAGIVLFILYLIFTGKATFTSGGTSWSYSSSGGSSWSSSSSSSFGGGGGGSFGGGGSSGSW